MDWLRIKEWLAFSVLGQIIFWKEYTTREDRDPKTDMYNVECRLLKLKQTYKILPNSPVLTIINNYKLEKYGLVKTKY